MDESAQPFGTAFLRSLWSGIDLKAPKCCDCDGHISPDGTLARTFTVQSQMLGAKQQHAEKVHIPTMNEVILIYHRHLECLFKSTRFVAISHVWHPDVAELQYKKGEALAIADDVELIVREVPARIYLGLMASLTGYFEVWHDYISVPQWQPSLKCQIILAIPLIFNQANMTVAYLSDIDNTTIEAMRSGDSAYVKCRGISNICNAKWFSRVWTAMEYTQSRELRTMLQDYTFIDDHLVHRPLVQEMWNGWSSEDSKQEDHLAVERMVGMGSNLVPWQLGPLELIRLYNTQGLRTSFGSAHDLLSRRCVTVRRDYFHALLSVLRIGLTEAQLSPDEHDALLQVAKCCIKVGDYSPLLMIPGTAQTNTDDNEMRNSGYLDLTTFALGFEEAPPFVASSSIIQEFTSTSSSTTVQVENIGSVRDIHRVKWSQKKPFETLTLLVRLVLESTGPNVYAFINTLGGCLYGQAPDIIFDRLREDDRLDQLRVKLEILCNSSSEYTDDSVSWIADNMGLSNTSLKSPMSNGTPMRFLEGHGGTIHLGDNGAVVRVDCETCNGNYLLRVAILKPNTHVAGAVAYRIPGLKYSFTREGGAGILLKHNEIVGRFLWGTPTCGCSKFEMIDAEAVLHDLPLPRPNTFEYGRQSETGEVWLPINSATRIRG